MLGFRLGFRLGLRLLLRLRATLVVIAIVDVAAAAVEHHHLARLDLRRVAGIAVAVFPRARLQRPFEIDPRAFLEIFAANLGQTAPGHHAVPLGLFDELAVLVLVGFVRGYAQVADGGAVASVAQFGVLPQVVG